MMKPLLLTALLALSAPTASAGDLDFIFRWKIAIGKHRQERDVRTDRRREVRIEEHCYRTWVAGTYETVHTKVFVPARVDRIWEPAVYGTRYDACGHPYQVLVREGFYRSVCVPAHYEDRCERVFRPGHWQYDCNTCGHHH